MSSTNASVESKSYEAKPLLQVSDKNQEDTKYNSYSLVDVKQEYSNSAQIREIDEKNSSIKNPNNPQIQINSQAADPSAPQIQQRGARSTNMKSNVLEWDDVSFYAGENDQETGVAPKQVCIGQTLWGGGCTGAPPA